MASLTLRCRDDHALHQDSVLCTDLPGCRSNDRFCTISTARRSIWAAEVKRGVCNPLTFTLVWLLCDYGELICAPRRFGVAKCCRVYEDRRGKHAAFVRHSIVDSCSRKSCNCRARIHSLRLQSLGERATQMSHFGAAKAWSIDLSFGTLSKYWRILRGTGACHHVTYVRA